jgi:hypothetical protein
MVWWLKDESATGRALLNIRKFFQYASPVCFVAEPQVFAIIKGYIEEKLGHIGAAC